MRPAGDDDYAAEPPPYMGGATGVLNPMPGTWRWKAPRREFAPGFHGANPGPSHPEAGPAPKRKPVAKRGAR